MHFGINENISYNGRTYHVQTEDGGLGNPVVTTVLFRDGTIVASRRTGYADIIKSDKLEVVVREIMREQHGSVLTDLWAGRFDAVSG
jgi:hypothetical protein